MIRYLKKFLHVIIFILITGIGALGQEETSIQYLLQDTAFLEKLPIPMAAISANSEQTQAIIEEVEENLGLTPEQLDRIDSILNELDVELGKFQGQISEEFLSTSSTIMLDKAISDIRQVDDRVNGFREMIQSEIQNKETQNEKIDRLIIIWNETYNAERTTKLSVEIRKNLQNVISDLKSVDSRVDQYLNNLLELELKLNEYHTEFDGLIKSINEARDEASKKLWLPDSDPIWEIYTTKKDSIEVEVKLKRSLDKQKNEAVEYYKELVSYDENVTESWWNLGVAYTRLGDYENAAKAFERSVEIGRHPVNLAELAALIDVYNKLGNIEKIIEMYTLGIDKFDTTNAFLYAGLARAYYEVGEYDLAELHALTALELDSSIAADTEKFLQMIELAKMGIMVDFGDATTTAE